MNKPYVLLIASLFVLISSLSLAVPFGESYLPSATAFQPGDCDAPPFDVSRLNTATGQLLFDVLSPEQGWQLYSTANDNALFARNFRPAVLSPDGLWLANVGIYDDTLSVAVLEVNGDEQYLTFIPDEDSAQQLHWLSNHELLTVFQPSGVARAEWYANEVINPFVGERYTVLPTHVAAGNISTTPIFPDTHDGEYFDVSPNGQYVLFQDLRYKVEGNTYEVDNVLYGIDDGTITPISHLSRPWLWSSDSTQIAFWGHGVLSADSIPNIHIYDIEQETVIQVTDLQLEQGESIRLFDTASWSSDRQYLAFAYGRWNEPYTLYILHVSSGEVTETCLVDLEWNTQPAWSNNGRYLAFYGGINQEEKSESEGIYIYDIQEMRLFKLHEGSSKIIGWAS